MEEVNGIDKKHLGIIQIMIFWVLEDSSNVLKEHITFSTQTDFLTRLKRVTIQKASV
jgi:hypothetical protein